MGYFREVLAVCGTAACIAYWVATRQDGQALSALLAFLGGLAIASAQNRASAAAQKEES